MVTPLDVILSCVGLSIVTNTSVLTACALRFACIKTLDYIRYSCPFRYKSTIFGKINFCFIRLPYKLHSVTLRVTLKILARKQDEWRNRSPCFSRAISHLGMYQIAFARSLQAYLHLLSLAKDFTDLLAIAETTPY